VRRLDGAFRFAEELFRVQFRERVCGKVMKIYSIDHVQLAMPPDGEARAREFYSGILGLAEVPKPLVLAKRGGLWFEMGPVKLHLGVEQDFRAAKKAHPALRIQGLDELADKCRRAGYNVTPDNELEGYNRAYIEDPFGNRIEFMELRV
jgi:catechol 2,3-dioxygenase-like lactoylglutathione lyase family enzyme